VPERRCRPAPTASPENLVAAGCEALVAGDLDAWREYTITAADFILKTMRTKEGRLLRTYGAATGQKPEARLNGYLDDYAYLVHGLLN